MTEKEFVMDILETEKNITINTAFALNEASNNNLYKEIFNIFKSISNVTKEVFTLAYHLGIYPLENEKNTKIKDAIKTLNNDLNND
ncbi:MAG: spore coat protein [Firmicutes bacterium]|nr:spore coat protein [Bacillota bacterium]